MYWTQNQRDLEAELKQLVRDEGYEYASGYFSSLAVEMLNLLPKRQQQQYIRMMRANNDCRLVEVENPMTGGPCDPSTETYRSM